MGRSEQMSLLGEQVAAVIIRLAEIPCPLTRSAIVVFDDYLHDEQDLRTLIVHLDRLHASVDQSLIGQRAQLAQFTDDLRTLRPELDAAPFRTAYNQRRTAVLR